MTQIIRTKQTNNEYQFSAYKEGWVLEIINDFGEYYTAKVLTGSVEHTDGVIAVHKKDCELIKIGEVYGSEDTPHMTTDPDITHTGPMIGSDGEYGGSGPISTK